jgi:hypothetical protein
MSISLRYADQRLVLICDRAECQASIIADPNERVLAQRDQLDALAEALHWRRTTDAGDYCERCAADLPPPIVPRNELCQRDAWCVLRHGHAGDCRKIGKRAVSEILSGPEMAKRRRY